MKQVSSSHQDSSQYSGRSRSVISKSSSPRTNLLVTVPSVPISISITVTFIFHSFFNSLARSKYLSFFWLSFNFTLWLARIAKSTILQVLFFCCYFKVWSILKIPKKFVRLILHDRFCIVHIPFDLVVKLTFLAQFPVDYYNSLRVFFTPAFADGPLLESE